MLFLQTLRTSLKSMNRTRNKLLIWMVGLVVSLGLGKTVTGATAVETHGALSVAGSQIVNENGESVALAGASLFWSNDLWGGERYYRENVVAYLQENWNATLVRASMGVEDPGGYLSNPAANRARVETVVDAAIANGMYVIIDWHSHHAEDHTAEAVTFFQAMATKYGETENVIYEIYNEPLSVSWSTVVKPYAETVIAAIRAIDPDNLIIVGSPRWSQNVHEAAANPILGYPNIAYTLHFYAGSHGASLRNRAQAAMNSGIALFVTEWGTVNANGDGAVNTASTEAWIAFLRENKISHANWAFNDKDEGASALIPGTNPALETWPDSALSESGKLVKSIVLGWDPIDYDNRPKRAFSLWLTENDLPENTDPDTDPFNTGRTLFHDFAFGIDPRSRTAIATLRFEHTISNRFTATFPAMQTSVDYVLEISNGSNLWSELSRTKGSGDWLELPLEVGSGTNLYAIKAVSE